MKKKILLIIFTLCLCGCNNSINNNIKDLSQDVPIENNKSDKYTFCYLYSTNSHITLSIYYDKNYNVIEDFTLISKTHNILSEAIKTEEEWQLSCNNMNENVECSVHRNDTTVNIGVKDFKPNYYYTNKVNELENNGWKCSEKDIES